MAVETADIIARMGRAAEVCLLAGISVTAQAAPASLLPRQLLEADDLGKVSPTRHMFSPWSMTRFASVTIFQCGLEVRGVLEALRQELLVASLAGVGTRVLVTGHGGRSCRCAFLRIAASRGGHSQEQQEENHQGCRLEADKVCSLFHGCTPCALRKHCGSLEASGRSWLDLGRQSAD